MAWIESHQSIEKNGKVLELSRILGINKHQAIGHLHSFWWWALDNVDESGDISKFDPIVISEAVGWTEYTKKLEYDNFIMDCNEKTPDERNFCLALLATGFIDTPQEYKLDQDKKLGDGAKIHDWEKYTWRYFASIKASEIKRNQGRERQKKWYQKNHPNANLTQSESVSLTQPNGSNLTKPNLTIPNNSVFLSSSKEAKNTVVISTSEMTTTNHDKPKENEEKLSVKGKNGAGKGLPDPKSLVAIWNVNRGPLAAVESITAPRIQKIKARLKERPDLDEWTKIVRLITQSPFLTGHGNSGWKANFDWLIRNETNPVKVLEGAYHNGDRAKEETYEERAWRENQEKIHNGALP